MSNRQQAEEVASRWIAQRETGSWTDADAAALAAWLAESASHRVAYYRFHAAWKEAGRMAVFRTPRAVADEVAAYAAAVDAAPAEPTLLTQRRPMAWVARISLAASVLIAVVALSWFWLAQQGTQFQTAVGGLATIPTADGSRLTLNTDTRLRVAMTKTARRVQLERGEAFFEVAKDAQRPFIVSVGDRSVIAVGTAFSIRHDGNDVRVSVTEGAVKMVPKQNAAQVLADLASEVSREDVVLLPAGSIATSIAGAVLVKQTDIEELERSLTWRSGMLTFRDTPLADAVAEFNRYNQRQIVIEDPAIASIEVGGIFLATNLETFLSLLEDGFSVAVKEENDKVVLVSK